MPRKAHSNEAEHKVVFLDEPTTGLDPQTKRLIWKSIYHAAEQNTVVLTTHNMEEADAICSRIGILVAGYVRALGAPQQLKQQHGNYYKILIQADEDGVLKAISELKDVRPDIFTGTPQQLNQQNYFQVEMRLHYTNKLSEVYAVLHNLAASGVISEFQFRYATLEDVFLTIVNAIEPPDEPVWNIESSSTDSE